MTSVDSAAAAGSFASGSQIDPVRPNDSPPAPEPSSSTSQLGQGRPPRPLTFDTLPPEIRTLVLSQAPDYNTLQALVLSSRVYYDSFSYSREQISRSVLRKYGSPVDGDITDLLLCFQTLQAARQTLETIARTFEQTKRFLARPHSDASVKTFAEVRSLLDISTAIEKVVDDYFAWALCRDPWTGKVRPAERAASSTERWRVRRAALRWYGYHLYFCSSEEIRDEFDHRYEFEFEDDEEYIEQANFKADHFFDLFTIGENEEIYSIHAYAQERYRQFFDRLDQHENWDRWWENKGITRWKKAEIYDSPLTYGEPIDFRPGQSTSFAVQMYMISQGPLFLSRVLDPKVWDNPPPLIIDNLKYEAIEDSMDEAMERYFEYWYRHTLHRSSSTPRCSTMDQPNVGLLWLIERHPSLLHEGGADLTHRELHPMRKNGIFIWDEVRLDAMDFFIRESRALEEAGAACTRCVDRTMTFNQPGWFNLTRRMSFDRDRKVMVTARVERWPEGKKSGT